MKKIFYTFLTLFAFLLFSNSIYLETSAHSLLPDEVVEFIQSKESVTDEEVEEFFKKTYGYSIEEFWENNPDPIDELMTPSDEFLQMQAENPQNLENLSADTLDQINKTSAKMLENNEAFQNLSSADQKEFLKQAMSLKFQNKPLSFFQNIQKFTPIGIQHILNGYDHILFILSILLLALSFRKLLLLISIFTISHSLTLILAGLEIITLPSTIVEPIIALSIIYTALTSLLSSKIKFFTQFSHHTITIFIFGLFHGLGFAGSFSDLNISSTDFILPLLSLNIGVEIGQLIIIGLSFPVFWMIRNQRGGKIILQIFALGIIGIALFWFWKRI